MNTILWARKAVKQLRKLDPQHQIAIRDGVTTLEGMPECQNIKSLINHPYGYRLRVGQYRVLFDWDGAIKIVQIEEVRKRDERTY